MKPENLSCLQLLLLDVLLYCRIYSSKMYKAKQQSSAAVSEFKLQQYEHKQSRGI